MAPLMPSLATGTNVYCPSEGTHGVASVTLSHGPEADLVDTTGISPPASNHGTVDSDGPNGDPLAEPPHGRHSQLGSSPPPPPSSPSLPTNNPLPADVVPRLASHSASTSYPSATDTTSAPSTSTASKHKQSALHASVVASQSNASALVNKKQQTTTGAVALNDIKESLNAFNTTLGHNLVMQQSECRCADTSPEHQAKAMHVLQDLESYLDDDRMVAFIDLFRADTAVADAYLAINHDSLRKRWVEKQLKDTFGFPSL